MKLKLHSDYGDRMFFVSDALECDEFPFMIVIEVDRKDSEQNDTMHYAMVAAVSLDIDESERFEYVLAETSESVAHAMSQSEVDRAYAIEMAFNGRYALLWSGEETNLKRLVNRAKEVAHTYADCDAFKRRMNEGQNQYGHTGWDMIQGNTFDRAKGEVR
jgi:hypothetical protein